MNTPTDDADTSDRSPPGDDLLAAELMLGLLDPDARRSAAVRAETDPAFARLVDDWDRRFSPWLTRVERVTPSDTVWPRIRRDLGWELPPQRARPTLWNNLALWRWATAAAAGLALAVVLLRPADLPQTGTTTTTQTAPVTTLTHDDGRAAWLVTVDASQGKVFVVPVPGTISPGERICELWIIPPGGTPSSLGAVSDRQAQTVSVSAALRGRLAAGAVLAVTLEDRQGVPHAAPAGPIVAKGEILDI